MSARILECIEFFAAGDANAVHAYISSKYGVPA